jgi:TatD DNase family protein
VGQTPSACYFVRCFCKFKAHDLEAHLLIDSHAHLDSERYADDRAAVLSRALDAGVGVVLAIGIGEHAAGMEGALKICREFNGQPNVPRLYASAGIYPHNTQEIDDAVLAKLDSLLAEPEVIACGEVGLDYYHEGAPHPIQRAGFIRQLEISAARKRPILIHCRAKNDGADGCTDAWDDLLEILETHWRPTGLGGVMHCFGSGWEQARRSLNLGFLISFAGNLTYPKAQPLRDVAAKLPLDGVLVETDAPWLAPTPDRGKRNEPAFVTRTAQTLAGLLAVPEEEIASATTKNFARLFGLGPVVGN